MEGTPSLQADPEQEGGSEDLGGEAEPHSRHWVGSGLWAI